jgi:hypothetical protein
LPSLIISGRKYFFLVPKESKFSIHQLRYINVNNGIFIFPFDTRGFLSFGHYTFVEIHSRWMQLDGQKSAKVQNIGQKPNRRVFGVTTSIVRKYFCWHGHLLHILHHVYFLFFVTLAQSRFISINNANTLCVREKYNQSHCRDANRPSPWPRPLYMAYAVKTIAID